jgi:hypothetical protein
MVPIQAWSVGDTGLFLWESNCYWTGADLATQPSTADRCGAFCIAYTGCKKFNHLGGTCFLKDGTGEFVGGQGKYLHFK